MHRKRGGITRSKNRGIVIFSLILGLGVNLVFPVLGLGEGVDIRIITSELAPVPAEPGKDLVLSVTIVNQGGGTAKNLSLEIIPDPVIILKNENKRIIRMDLGGYAAWAETYYLHIDPSAVSGVYKIEIKALREGEGESKTIDVIVKGIPQLTLSNVSIKPEIISPGNNFTLNFSVSNLGTGIANAIRITSQIDSLPFTPAGTNTLMIEELSPSNSKTLEFHLLVKDNANPASYLVPIRLDYKSEDGRNFSVSELVGVNVLGKSKLNIAGINTDPSRIEKGNYLTLTIRIENTGNGDAKSVKASIDIPFKGTKTAFLGKIEPDEDAPAVFNLQANEAGNYKYRLTAQYEDDLGAHEYQQDLDIVVYDTGNPGIIVVLAVIVILGVAYFGYTRLRKK